MLAISFGSSKSNGEHQKRVLFTKSCFIFHGVDIVMLLFGMKLTLNSLLKQNSTDSRSWHVGGSDVAQIEFHFHLLR